MSTIPPFNTGILDEDLVEGEEEDYPLTPNLDTPPAEFGQRWVDYSERGENDVMLSGPITGGWGPGRWRANRRKAYWALVALYGEARVVRGKQTAGRWSFLVRNLKQNKAAA